MTKQDKNTPDYSMGFEITMKQFFGAKADHIADHCRDDKEVKKWLSKVTKEMMKEVDKIDTTTRHKEMLMSDLEKLEKQIRKWEKLWEMVFVLFDS